MEAVKIRSLIETSELCLASLNKNKIIITSRKSAPVAAWGEVAWIW